MSVGKGLPLQDGVDKVTGRARFAGDISFPGMLHIKVTRAKIPHGRVLSVQPDRAMAMPGVVKVITAADVKGLNAFGNYEADQPVLVGIGQKVRYLGDPVALVVAETEEQATRAAAAVAVEYERLPIIADPETALAQSGPCVHEHAYSCGIFEYTIGNPALAFAEAPVVIEQVYRTARQEHAYLEPESGVATVEPDGTVTVYAGVHDPYHVRYCIARSLDLPESRVRVVAPPMGGSYGGKQGISVHIHLALAASLTGRPVRLVWTREESLVTHTKRDPTVIRHRLAATRDGQFLAMDVEALLDAGAYVNESPGSVRWLALNSAGPYRIPNVHVRGQAVFTNNIPSGAFRGMGAPMAVFATESQVDILARRLGMDPYELRLKNGVHQDDPPSTPGVVLDGPISLQETMSRAMERARDPVEPPGGGWRVGRGFAVAMPLYDVAAVPLRGARGTAVIVEIFRDSTLLVRSGVVDYGTGITTVLSQIAAQEMGLDPADIRVVYGDVATTLNAGPTLGSRSAYTSGNAIIGAAAELKAVLAGKAAELLGVAPGSLVFANKSVFCREQPERRVPLNQVVAACYRAGIKTLAEFWFTSDDRDWGHTFITTVADVAVHERTGEAKVLRIITAQDVGKAINPLNIIGQMNGASAQGIGFALFEDFCVKNGSVPIRTLGDYPAPTALDMTGELLPIIVEQPDAAGPYGAKGVAEHAMCTVPAAIINAIFDAAGVRMTDLPAVPQRIWRALRQSTDAGSPH